MISISQVKKYCNDDITKIENYEEAIADTMQVWCCHHRMEIMPFSRKQVSQEYLKKQGMFYKRPSNELIFVTRSEHKKIHSEIGKNTRFDGIKKPWKKAGTYTLEQRKHMSDSAKKRGNTNEIPGIIKKWLRSQEKILVISGYFAANVDKHKGYQEYLKSAQSFGRPILVILSNKEQWLRKYGFYRNRSFYFRDHFLNLKVMTSKDTDMSQCKTLGYITKYCSDVIFYKDGGEYNLDNLPEAKVPGIKVVFGSNPKVASSSEILGIKKISNSGEEKR